MKKNISLVTNRLSTMTTLLTIFVFSLFVADTAFAAAVPIKWNQSANVTWRSESVYGCNASGNWSGGKGVSGSQPISASSLGLGSKTFIITCTSSITGGPITASTEVNVINEAAVQVAFGKPGSSNPYSIAPTLSLARSDSYVAPGDWFELSWNYSNPYGSCTASNAWSGSKTPKGSLTIMNTNNLSSDRTRTYRLTCSTPGFTDAVASVSVTFGGRACGGTTGYICP